MLVSVVTEWKVAYPVGIVVLALHNWKGQPDNGGGCARAAFRPLLSTAISHIRIIELMMQRDEGRSRPIYTRFNFICSLVGDIKPMYLKETTFSKANPSGVLLATSSGKELRASFLLMCSTLGQLHGCACCFDQCLLVGHTTGSEDCDIIDVG